MMQINFGPARPREREVRILLGQFLDMDEVLASGYRRARDRFDLSGQKARKARRDSLAALDGERVKLRRRAIRRSVEAEMDAIEARSCLDQCIAGVEGKIRELDFDLEWMTAELGETGFGDLGVKMASDIDLRRRAREVLAAYLERRERMRERLLERMEKDREETGAL